MTLIFKCLGEKVNNNTAMKVQKQPWTEQREAKQLCTGFLISLIWKTYCLKKIIQGYYTRIYKNYTRIFTQNTQSLYFNRIYCDRWFFILKFLQHIKFLLVCNFVKFASSTQHNYASYFIILHI